MYGTELILDIHDCRKIYQHNQRREISEFCAKLTKLLKMEDELLVFWDYDGDKKGYRNAPPHLKGTTAVQFIKTSNITVHYLVDLQRVYLNVFSCKRFDSLKATEFCLRFWGGVAVGGGRLMERR